MNAQREDLLAMLEHLKTVRADRKRIARGRCAECHRTYVLKPGGRPICGRCCERWINSFVTERDFAGALLAAGRNGGPALLIRWIGRGLIGTAELAPLLPDVWTSAEWPEKAFPQDLWVGLFRRVGFVSDPVGIPAPTGLLTVYRGATPKRRDGMSWTRDRKTAEWFAWRDRDRFRFVDAGVFTAIAPPQAVLAAIDSRNEAEIVVEPSRLVGVCEEAA
jgi:hypothetical protein